LFTAANADTFGQIINRKIESFVRHSHDYVFESCLGSEGYFNAMSFAKCMVGNSSSGLIEAPSFKLPVVNVGDRQQGRLAAKNVIHVSYHADAIYRAIARACSASFKKKLSRLKNPYYHGGATNIILSALERVKIDQKLIEKEFIDLHYRNA
jgi:UDP-N-acetylglucosamine 2-epimerase